jgi:hypothetical protein
VPTRRSTTLGFVLSRRAVALAGLTVTALGATSGCAGDTAVRLPGRAPLDDDEDRRLLAAALRREQELLARVQAAGRDHRPLRRALAGAASVHQRHVALLADALDVGAPSAASGSTPRTAGATLAALARFERRLAERHADAAVAAGSGTVARLLAGLSAAAAQQDWSLSGQAAATGGRA